jgi:hypothetical protein
MYEAQLKPVSNRADWLETIELIDDDTGQVITDLSEVTVKLEVRQMPNCYRALTGSSDDGHVTYPGNGVIQWHFTKSEMSNLCAGTYEIGVTVTLDDFTEQELIGSLPVVDGIVRS